MTTTIRTLFLFNILFAPAILLADEPGELIFSDDFERNESQEEKDEIGKGWGSNSAKRANGNKQVDLKNGAMYIRFHPSADHAVSVTHPAEFTDGAVGMKFMLENENDSLGLNFADLKYKKVHAGHLFMTRISTKKVQFLDLKTGNMDLEIRTARQNKTLSAEQKKLLKSKSKVFPNPLKTGQWYQLLVTVAGDRFTVTIDGKEVGSFQSEGIAHPTKRLLRLSVPKEAVVDDVKIWKKK